MNISEKAALITGGARRIGKEIVIFLAEMGYDIALHYNTSKQAAVESAEKVRDFGVNCELFQYDFVNNRNIHGFMKRVHTSFPNLSLLINNASIFEKQNIAETSPEQFDNNFLLHSRTPFFLIQKFISFYKRGHIINIVDSRVLKNDYAYAAYTLSKKSLADLTCMAACEFAPDVRVNAIAPGIILVPSGTNDAHLDRRSSMIPIKRKGNTDNIVSALEYLLKNDFITGQILYVDGGESL